MGIEQSVARLQELCRTGIPADIRKLFTRQPMLCGEGADDIVSDEDTLLESLRAVVEMTPKLTIKIHASRQLTADSVLTWLQWSSPTPDNRETLAFRSMTVWIREDSEWKIAGDMYGMGYFSAP